jgi:copper chaperone CopZ
MSAEPTASRESSLRLAGLSCMMCVKHLTHALEKIDGVFRTQVTLDPPCAMVRYDPERTTPGALIGAVRAAGYDAQL